MTPATRTPAGSSDIRLNAGGGADGGRVAGRGAAAAPSHLRGRENNINSNSNGTAAAAAAEAAAGVAESGAGSGAGEASAGEGEGGGIGHLIGLGARLGTFFPSAVGPGPVPGLQQLLREASDAVSTAEQYPPTPGYKYGGVGFPDAAAAGAAGPRGSATEAAEGSARFLATPGLTPIPTARTPGVGFGGDMGAGGGDGGGGEEDTPSMFLAGLLRGGSPAIAGTPGVGVGVGGDYEEDEDGHGGAAGARATRMAAAGLAPPTTGGAAAAGGGRATRAAGGRRIGGRLSFSSAVGMDDGSGAEGVAAGGRAHARRWVARGSSTVVHRFFSFFVSGFEDRYLVLCSPFLRSVLSRVGWCAVYDGLCKYWRATWVCHGECDKNSKIVL